MSERTYRAVIAGVLIGALVLALAVAIVLLSRNPAPQPTPLPSQSEVATAAPSIEPTASRGPAFLSPTVIGVGSVPAGSDSPATFSVSFVEPTAAAIPDAEGSLRLTLVDGSGNGDSIAFVGTPVVDAPDSLAASAALVAPNVLEIRIAASDVFNTESLTVGGLSIRVSRSAAAGPIRATVGGFAGSLAGGIISPGVPSPGTVVAASQSPGG